MPDVYVEPAGVGRMTTRFQPRVMAAVGTACLVTLGLLLASRRLGAQATPPQGNSGSVAPALPATHTGEAIFRATCATCHAVDGKGSPRSVVGFDKPLPDFTDCAFATAETHHDWQSVVHEGGPIRALDHHMPSFGEALSADDIALVVAYIKKFCGDPAWPQGDLNFPRSFFTEKAFPESESVLTTGFTGRGDRSVGNDVEYERRIGSRAQFSADIPLDFQEATPGQPWSRGLGDVEFAFKRTLYSSYSTGGILATGGAITFPTGDATGGLGDGVRIYEPFVMWDQRLTATSFLQTQTGFKASSDTNVLAHSAYFDAAAGKTFSADRGFGRQWTPQLEVLWAKPNGGASDWDVVPQMQVTLSKLQHIRIAGGVRLPLTDRTDRHAQVLVYFLWDWADGGLFEGWK